MSTTIIIGTSAAGLATANKLRDLDPTAEIICLTKETSMPYNRCLLADFLGGSRTEEEVHTRKQQFFAEKNIELQLDTQVTGLDVAAQKVMLHNGTTLAYDNLVIATGRSAFVPPQLDTNQPGVFPFYDLDHVTNILAYQAATNATRVLVIGAGITGLECSDALHQRGLQITVVERSSQILARQMDHDGAQFLQTLIESKGIALHLGTTIAGIEGSPLMSFETPHTVAPQDERALKNNHIFSQDHSTTTTDLSNQKSQSPAHPEKDCKSVSKDMSGHNPRYTVTLSNGTVIEVDMIIAATGGRQNLGFARDAGITCDEFGIVTDDGQATNIPNIFAAGDVCSIINLASSNRTFSTLWPDAVAQGLTVAHSIVGLSKPYAGTLNITSTNIFNTTLVTCGDFAATSGLDTLNKTTAEFYHRFYLSDGILQAFVMVGNVGSVGQLRKAILEKTRIG